MHLEKMTCVICFGDQNPIFGVHPQVTAEALPQMTARCAISFQYFSTSVLLHLRKSITPLITSFLQTPQNSFWYVLRESTVYGIFISVVRDDDADHIVNMSRY